jgi:hypothetical protein
MEREDMSDTKVKIIVKMVDGAVTDVFCNVKDFDVAVLEFDSGNEGTSVAVRHSSIGRSTGLLGILTAAYSKLEVEAEEIENEVSGVGYSDDDDEMVGMFEHLRAIEKQHDLLTEAAGVIIGAERWDGNAKAAERKERRDGKYIQI